jgi:hypothetical protein
MPTYIYLCQNSIEEDGHGEFEELHSSSDEAKLKECPFCRKEKDISTPVKRLINSTTPGVVELTGRDAIDKAKVDAAQFKRDVHKSEHLYSNVLGHDKYQSLQQRIDKQRKGG